MSQRDFMSLSGAESVKRIAFDDAEVVGLFAGGHLLIVRGEAPCLNMDVRLSPLIYIDCPEYWGIEVVGTLPGGICLPAVKPFVVAIPLAGATGSKGIEVLGANEIFDPGWAAAAGLLRPRRTWTPTWGGEWEAGFSPWRERQRPARARG